MDYDYLLVDKIKEDLGASRTQSLKHRTIVALLKWYARLPR